MLLESPDESQGYLKIINVKPYGPHLQQESIVMRYMNHFAIDEGNQFEIIAIHTLKPGYHDRKILWWVEFVRILQAIPINRSDGTFANELHVIWGSNNGFSLDIADLSKLIVENCGYKSAMVSILDMFKQDCITKERFDVNII